MRTLHVCLNVLGLFTCTLSVAGCAGSIVSQPDTQGLILEYRAAYVPPSHSRGLPAATEWPSDVCVAGREVREFRWLDPRHGVTDVVRAAKAPDLRIELREQTIRLVLWPKLSTVLPWVVARLELSGDEKARVDAFAKENQRCLLLATLNDEPTALLLFTHDWGETIPAGIFAAADAARSQFASSGLALVEVDPPAEELARTRKRAEHYARRAAWQYTCDAYAREHVQADLDATELETFTSESEWFADIDCSVAPPPWPTDEE